MSVDHRKLKKGDILVYTNWDGDKSYFSYSHFDTLECEEEDDEGNEVYKSVVVIFAFEVRGKVPNGPLAPYTVALYEEDLNYFERPKFKPTNGFYKFMKKVDSENETAVV